MPFLELGNTLTVIFVASEIGIRNRPLLSYIKPVLLWVVLNVLSSSIFLESLAASTIGAKRALLLVTDILAYVEYPIFVICKRVFGSSVLMAVVAASCTFVIRRVSSYEKSEVSVWKNRKDLGYSLLGGSIVFVLMQFHTHDGDTYIRYIFTVVVVAFFFTFAAYLDVRREMTTLTFTLFLPHAALGLRWILPVFPCLMVGFSLLFFVLVLLVEGVGIDSHILNYPIYYGTLYGPFSLIYWNVKKKLLKSGGGLMVPQSQKSVSDLAK